MTAQVKNAHIHRLEIFSRFRQINKGDNHQMEVRGFDDEGNIFNNLEGFKFDWATLEGHENFMRISPKEAGHNKMHREVNPINDDDFFLRALKPGFSTISVKILEPGYEHVAKASIKLTIVEPFVIEPADPQMRGQSLFILPTSQFRFKLMHVAMTQDQGVEFYDITIPHKQYHWGLLPSSEKLGTIGEDGLFQSLKAPGRAEIKVFDQRFSNNTAETDIQIVEPFSLQLQCADVTSAFEAKGKLENSKTKTSSFEEQLGVETWSQSWIWVEGKTYIIKVLLFDRDHNPIILSDNVEFSHFIDEKFLKLIDKNLIGSELIVKVDKHDHTDEPVHAHKSIVKAQLKGIKTSLKDKYVVDSNKIKDEKEITITGPVTIPHPTASILLPYVKTRDGRILGEQWQMRALGGSGTYVWSSSDPTIARMAEREKLWSVNVGSTIIKASDLHNPENFATIVVEVQPVHHLTWLEDRLEARKGVDTALLSSIAVDFRGRKFTNCTSLEFRYEVKGDGATHDEPVLGDWTRLQNYVHQQEALNLIKLRHRFDLEPATVFGSELKAAKHELSAHELEVLQHNNFGICDQVRVKAKDEGLARVKAFWETSERIVESEKAEIASYDPLRTVRPEYLPFLGDLQSRSQSGQEFQTFDSFSPHAHEQTGEHQYVLSFGSSMDWELYGGGNFWREFTGEYQTTWKVLPNNGTSEDILELELKSLSATSSVITAMCKAPQSAKQLNSSFSYQIQVSQQGRLSRHLLKPQIYTDSVRLSCEPPATERLLWSQAPGFKANNLALLPRSRFVDNERTHYVLVNTSHYVRLIMLDKHGFASLNHSSILSTISSSDSNLASVDDDLSSGYDKRNVHVHNQTGTVVLKSASSAYVTATLAGKQTSRSSSYFGSGSTTPIDLSVGHPVHDSLRLEVVSNVEIEPKFKAIYFLADQNTWKFKLLQGSGHFAVSLNDTSLADVQHVGREVTILPQKEGTVQIRVEDVEVPGSLIATAELVISGVAHLHLDSQGYLLEQGATLNMTVTAFDNFGNEFDPDQYERMAFALEIEMTGIHRTRGLLAAQVPGEHRVFSVTGVEPGNYVVTAYVDRSFLGTDSEHSARVTSEANKLEVFPVLTLVPSTLLLTPNMRYTLRILGGPSRGSYGSSIEGSLVDIRFDIEDSRVASIDSLREITAREVGDTSLAYTIIQTKQARDGKEWRNIVSKRTLPIRVRLVTSIEIPSNQQRIVYSGSMLKQLAVLKHHNETFSHGVAPISWDWNCSHPGILRPHVPSDSDSSSSQLQHYLQTKVIRNNSENNDGAVFTTTFNSSSIHAKALKAGEAILSVRMAIEYPDLYRREANWFQNKALLKVQDRLAISVPEFIPDSDKQTHLYLLPPNSLSKITTNKHTRLKLGYSMQSVYDYTTQQYEYQEAKTPIISLVNDDAIRTFDKYGKVTVIVEENQAFSDQVVMLNILITDIYTLAAHTFHEALSLPLGSSIKLPIKFYNEHAHLFANNIEGVQVGIELSHPRVVTAELDEYNSTLILQSEGSGECNVVLYLINNPAIFDVFRVRVATIVQPSSPVFLHIGSEDGTTWTSSNPRVLDIHSQDGSAVARSEGRADIMLSNNINAASIVHVSKVKHAELEHQGTQDLLLNVDDSNDFLRTRVKLFLQNQVEDLMPISQFDGLTLIRQNVALKCETDQPKFLEAQAEVSEVEGFFCNIKFIGSKRDSYKNIPKKAKVTVSVSGSTKGAKGKRELVYQQEVLQFEVKLVGKVLVEQAFQRGISMGQFSRSKTVSVLSLADFTANSTLDTKNLQIRKSRDVLNPNQHELTITVPRSVASKFSGTINIQNSATGEVTSLPVRFDPSDTKGKQKEVESQAWAQQAEPVQNVSSNKAKQKHPEFNSRSSSRDEDSKKRGQESPRMISYVVLLFIVCVGLFLGKDTPIINMLLNLFYSCLGFLNLQPRGSHYRGRHSDRTGSSWGTALDRSAPLADGSYLSRGSGNVRGEQNFYAQVRNRVHTSPDAKIVHDKHDSGAPINRFQQSRGSVVSPQSMYRRVQNESIYKEGHY